MTDLTLTVQRRSVHRTAKTEDEQAFERLVEPYRRAPAIDIYGMRGSRHEGAEDIVQETLFRASGGLESYHLQALTQSWLYRIATNVCLDELQRRSRHRQSIESSARAERRSAPFPRPRSRRRTATKESQL